MVIDNLQGKDLIDWVVAHRSAGKTMEQLAEELGVTKDTLKGRYKRAKVAWEKKNGTAEMEVVATSTGSIPMAPKDVKRNINVPKVAENVLPGGGEVLQKEDKGVLDRLDKIIDLLEKNTIVPTKMADVPQMHHNTIVVPQTEEYVKSSIRVAKDVWENFLEFCKDTKQYRQQDLVSLALAEFLEKYK